MILKEIVNLNQSKIFIVCLLFVAFGMSSCMDTTYEKYMPIKDNTWSKEQACCFEFQVDDSTLLYDIDVEVRNNNFYPYQNLWLLCEELHADSIFVRDTLNCELADVFGKWHGSGISIFQTSFPLRKSYRFPKTGKYSISIKHGMRNDALLGIREVGVRLTSSCQCVEK